MPVVKKTVDLIGTSAVPVQVNAGQSLESPLIELPVLNGAAYGGKAVFGSTPDGNIKVEIFSAPDDANPDTENYAVMELAYIASTTVRKARPLNAFPVKCKMKITNLDSADPVNVWGYLTYPA